MEILSISGSMYKKAIFVFLTILLAFSAVAEDTVEVMGNVSVAKTYAYVEPSFESKALASLTKNSKVLIINQEGDWLKVMLYNRQEGYVYAKYVAFRDENITRGESESKTLIDITNLLDQFNDTIQTSWFAEKQKVMPSLLFQQGKTPDDITLLYTAVNQKGDPVPSLKENPLKSDMLKLIELIYMKMIVHNYNSYRINIVVPDFVSGAYKGRMDSYVTLTLQKNFTNIDEIKNGTGSVWDYVRSVKKPEELFKDYPH